VVYIGQGECLQILEGSDRWMTSKEISEILNQRQSAIGLILLKLFQHNEVLRRKSTTTKMGYEYKKIE